MRLDSELASLLASFLDVKKRVGHSDAWTPRKTLAITNPFAPGSGVKPPELVGQQGEIDAFDLLVAHAKSNTVGTGG